MANWKAFSSNLSDIGQALGQRAREQRLRTEAMYDDYQKALDLAKAKAEIEFEYRDKQHEQQLKRIDAFMKNQQSGTEGGKPYGASPAQPTPPAQPIAGLGRIPQTQPTPPLIPTQSITFNPLSGNILVTKKEIENPLFKQAREKRLSEEAQRRDFRSDFESIMNVGGTIGEDSIKRMNEAIGFDIKSQLESGRGVPMVDKDGNRTWRVLSEKEWARRVNEGKFDTSEIEHLNTIKEEHRAWQNVLTRLEKMGINRESAGKIEFESVNTPLGVISIPARFNVYAQFAKDPQYTAVKRDIELAFQAFRKRVTGAQASDQELSRLRPVIASFKDRPEVFFDTVKNAMENATISFEDRLNMYEAAGRDVTKFRDIAKNEMGGGFVAQEVTRKGNSYKIRRK